MLDVYTGMAAGAQCMCFSVEAAVKGYHAYKDICAATMGEQLPCQSEQGNTQDVFSVAVLKDGVIVGHNPQKISSACSMFLSPGGSILCQVTESERYSAGLPQGSLNVPCALVFKRRRKDKNLLQALSIQLLKITSKSQKHGRKIPD